MPTHFYFDEVRKPKCFILKQIRVWLKELEKQYHTKIENLNYVFVNDEKLLSINQDFLNHETYTDIITFNLAEHSLNIHGEIYISLDRVVENAHKFEVDFLDEILRVVAHGILHLIGFDDKKSTDKKQMRKEENNCIQRYHQLFP
jgi:probable rRNA maturation factor